MEPGQRCGFDVRWRIQEAKRKELGMSTKAQSVEMRLEIVVVPVSDVDRAKRFYGGLGWRLDADFAAGDDFRVIQFTPPGSGCSVIFGKNVTAAAPGSARGLYLIVSNIEAARTELFARGVEVSEAFHAAGQDLRPAPSTPMPQANGPPARLSANQCRPSACGCQRGLVGRRFRSAGQPDLTDWPVIYML